MSTPNENPERFRNPDLPPVPRTQHHALRLGPERLHVGPCACLR
jgi:hypothetical protein